MANGNRGRPWGSPRFVALLVGCGAAAVLLLAAPPSWRPHGPVALDSMNPFGSVQDDSLPSELGQPPTLNHLMSTTYGPGFNDVGQPSGTRRSALSGPYVSQFSPNPHIETGQISPDAYFDAKEKRGRDPMIAQPTYDKSTWYQGPSTAYTYPQYASGSRFAPSPTSPGGGYVAAAGFGGQHGIAGAASAPREEDVAPDDMMFARAEYWRALDAYHDAETSAEYESWLDRRSSWELQDSSFWKSVSTKGVKRPSLAAVKDGVKAAESKAQKAVVGEKRGAREHYREAGRLFAKASSAAKLAGGSVTAPSWGKAQASWDYFYATNRLLDSRQKAIDQKRAEALGRVLPLSDRHDAVKVSSFVRPWTPFPGCHEGVNSPLCDAAEALRFPKSAVGFSPNRARSMARGGGRGRNLRKQQALAAVKARAQAAGATAKGEKELCLEKCADDGCKASCKAGARKVEELDTALKPLNDEQARLNRARMLLYLREFGPLKAMLSAKRAAKTTQLPWYPGDFKQPRSTDCAEPGFCHQWADGQYIDSWAEASTNWDTMGSHDTGYLHWDSMAEDSWNGGYDNVPINSDERHYRGDHGDRFGYTEGHPREIKESDAPGKKRWGPNLEDPDDEEFEDEWNRADETADDRHAWVNRDKGFDSGPSREHEWNHKADNWGRSNEWEDDWDFPNDYNDLPRSAQRDGEAQDVDDRKGLYKDLPDKAKEDDPSGFFEYGPDDAPPPADDDDAAPAADGAATAGSDGGGATVAAEGGEADSAAAPAGEAQSTKGRLVMLSQEQKGRGRMRKGRMMMLAQLPKSPLDFDWAKFNSQQAGLERRAKAAADMLMSKHLQDEPTHRLFVTADPSLAAQIAAAQRVQKVSGKRAAVGGLGRWGETHDPTRDGMPGKPADFLQDWTPPRGLPFGGSIATRPLSKKEKEQARGTALKHKLDKIEGLMDHQWSGGDNSITAPLAARDERRSAVAAADSADKALSQEFHRHSRTYSSEKRLQAPAAQSAISGEMESATNAIDRALSSTTAAHADDPSSTRQRSGLADHLEAAQRLGSKLAGRVRAAGGSEVKVELDAAAKEEAVQTRLQNQVDANERLKSKLKEAEAEGFGKGYKTRMETMEQSVAKIVASKLSPKVMSLAASKVASDVESKNEDRREFRADDSEDGDQHGHYDEDDEDGHDYDHDRVGDKDMTPAERERMRQRRHLDGGKHAHHHSHHHHHRHRNPAGGYSHRTVVDPKVVAAGGQVRPVRGEAMQAYGSWRLGKYDNDRVDGRRGRRPHYRGKFGHLWVKRDGEKRPKGSWTVKGDTQEWDSKVDPEEIAYHGGRRHMHDECDHYGEAGCSKVWEEEKRKRRSYCATWQGRSHMHRHARRYCFGNYHPGNERDGWAKNRAGRAPARYAASPRGAPGSDWTVSSDEGSEGSEGAAQPREGAEEQEGAGSAGGSTGGGRIEEGGRHEMGVPDSSDEPIEMQGGTASTYPGRSKEWKPNYFHHAFWSELYHYFKGDRPDEYCNVCVGEFMTALQDIKIPSEKTTEKARAEQVPQICKVACETNTNGGFTFHRPVFAQKRRSHDDDSRQDSRADDEDHPAKHLVEKAPRAQSLVAQANEQYQGGFH